jgi:hypothetical protein
VAATLPALPWVAAGLLAGGFACLVGGVLLIAVPLRRASGHQDPGISYGRPWA